MTRSGRTTPGLFGGCAAVVLLFALALIPFSRAAGQETPEAVVRAYYAVLLDVMRNARTLGYAGRFTKLEPVVDETFNLDFIARAALSRAYWKTLDARQRDAYIAAFRRLSVATYASRFKDYTGEAFEVVGANETRRKDMLVRTRIVKSDGEAVPINYLLRRRDGVWRVIDVFLKGTISEVATRRSDFSSIMREKGYEALIAAIDDKVSVLESE